MKSIGKVIVGLAAAGGAATAYSQALGPWQRRWGATDDEVSEPLPGDAFVPSPQGQATRAITVNAAPEHVWPWLVQMGHGRGGFYSWDFLDIAFGVMDTRSSKRVLPEWQHLDVGDHVPVKHGPPFPVLLVDPGKALVLGSGDPAFAVTWQTVLRPQPDGTTRLITRNRIVPPPGIAARITTAVLDVAAYVMVRRWLQVLKDRGEGLAAGKYS